MLARARRFMAGLAVVGSLLIGQPLPAQAAGCSFELGFKLFHNLTGGLVGSCLDNEHHNPVNGDGLQTTTEGLLVWRKSDNWTAFTDGYHTWVNGPNGIQERLNSQRFSWEQAGPGEGGARAVPSQAQAAPQVSFPSNWLGRLNFVRSLGQLPALVEDSSLNPGAQNHARYMVKNGIVAHAEDPGNAWYTASGNAAAQSSELIAFSWNNTDSAAIDGLAEGPFHALGLLDPSMTTVGYGSDREQGGSLQTGAAVHLGAGWGGARSAGSQPMIWPANGTSVPLYQAAVGEHPDPLSACPGYSQPAGLPLIFELGVGASGASVGGHSLSRDGSPVESCVYSASSYTNPDSGAQATGRAILGAYNAVIIVPRQPLNPGSTYSVSLTVNGQGYNWSFQAAPR